jgi:hypothetical protein
VRGLLVSVIDVLGIFVPGFLLLIGILLFPPLSSDLLKQWPTWTVLLEVFRNNIWTWVVFSAIASYVLGFIIRLCSIRLVQSITKHWWAEKLKKRAKVFEAAIKTALKDKELCETIEADAKSERITSLAPYFHFVKRIVRSGPPVLWAESERMEADIRFAVGIFVPLLIFVVDGLWLASLSGLILAVVSGIGAFIIIATFPSRRIREVINNYYLALVVLRYVPKFPVSIKSETTDDAA